MCQCKTLDNEKCSYPSKIESRLICLNKSNKESVNHPDHYLKESGYEVIDVIKAWKLDFELGNALKYIARAGRKNPSSLDEDLQKAMWYINYKLKQKK